MQQPEAEQHVERLAWRHEARSAIEMLVGQEMIPRDGRDNGGGRVEDYYIETAAGQRFLDSTIINAAGVARNRTVRTFDGERGADVTYERGDVETQNHIVTHRHFGTEDKSERPERPKPIIFDWVGRKPLHEALPSAEYLGRTEVIGRECDQFLFKEVQWYFPQDHIYSLDRETSVPLKVEAYRNAEAREAGKPLWVWTATKLDEVEGQPFVLESRSEEYSGESGTHSMTRDFRVESIAFDKEYPESTFRPTLQPGVAILDAITGKVSHAPGEREAAPAAADLAATAGPTSAATVAPIQAEPPRSWTSYATPASLGLGAAALLAGLALWWRRG